MFARGDGDSTTSRWPLTDLRQSDMLATGGDLNAIKSIETPQIHHAARRRSGCVAACGSAVPICLELRDPPPQSHLTISTRARIPALAYGSCAPHLTPAAIGECGAAYV
jgi:hypothetical protein